MNPSWTVMKFLNKETVEAVPTNWIDGTNCYWPTLYTQEKFNNAIRKQENFNSCWPQFPIEVFRNGTFDDYLTARNKSKNAEYTSDLGSDVDRKMRKLRKQKVLSSSSDDEAPSILHSPPRRTHSSPRRAHSPSRRNLIPKVADPLYGTNNNDGVHHQKQNSRIISETLSENGNFNRGDTLKTIVRNQALMRNILTDVMQEMKNIQKVQKPIEEEEESVFENLQLPINNEAELNDLEELLKFEINFKKCVYELSKIDGSNIYEFVKRCLIMLFTNQFASAYSWQGAKKKQKFCLSRVAEAIIVAADRQKWNRKDTEEAVKKWLRRAKERSVNENQHTTL